MTRVTTDVGVLRQYAKNLADIADELKIIQSKLAEAKLPSAFWPPPSTNDKTPFRDIVEAGGEEYTGPPEGTYGELQAAYDEAHDATVARLRKYGEAYRMVAENLRLAAKNYENANR